MHTQYFTGTRGGQNLGITFKNTVLNPGASFGGLYTLEKLPKFDSDDIKEFSTLNYEELTRIIFNKLGLNIDKKIQNDALKLYQKFHDKTSPAPLYSISP